MATAVRPLEITRFSKPTPRFSILWLFQGEPGLATPLGFLLPLVTNRTFGNKQNRLYRPYALPVTQPTVSKHWRELTTGLYPFLIHCQTPKRKGVALFTLVFWWQCLHQSHLLPKYVNTIIIKVSLSQPDLPPSQWAVSSSVGASSFFTLLKTIKSHLSATTNRRTCIY